MAQRLRSRLTVTNLAAGASITVAHGLQRTSSADGLIPTRIAPTTVTPIGVATANSSTITFTNYGDQTETATFNVERAHSVEDNSLPANAAWWQGYAGFKSFLLTTPQWNDVLVSPFATTQAGANPPNQGVVATDGVAGPGSALSWTNAAGTSATTAAFGDFSTDFSLVCWVNTPYAGGPARSLMYKAANFNLYLQTGTLRFQLQGKGVLTVPGYVVGARQCIVVSVDNGASDVLVRVWIDGVLRLTTTQVGVLAANNANAIFVGGDGVNRPGGIMDEVRIYQAVLTGVDATELYNSGAGTEAEPSSGPTLLAGWHFNEGAGNTADNYEGTAARDLALTNHTWVAGLIAATTSRGVLSPVFSPGVEQELFFQAQLPHSYDPTTSFHWHAHALNPVAGDGIQYMEFGLEWWLVDIMSQGPVNTTTVLARQTVSVQARYHHVFEFQVGGVDYEFGPTSISGIMIARIFRKSNDTYPYGVFMIGTDGHVKLNSLGSRLETSK